MEQKNDNFRVSFKYYKQRRPPPDLNQVIDFDHITNDRVTKKTLTKPNLPEVVGLIPVDQWNVYCHEEIPGFYLIRNPFKAGYQQYWVKRCLHDYPSKPNVTNLDAHMDIKDTDNIWKLGQRDKESKEKKTLMDKLRWVTLGYHHNWDTKEYHMDHHTAFPADLSYLSRYIVEALGQGASYRAEAAIINYYHLDSTLAGHTDHSEFDQVAPLVSFSFGQTAIFLMGGPTKETDPLAMFLRSGDISIMSGPCRLNYHAVPKVLAPCDSNIPACLRTSKDMTTVTKEDSEQRVKDRDIESDSEMDNVCLNEGQNCDVKSEDIGSDVAVAGTTHCAYRSNLSSSHAEKYNSRCCDNYALNSEKYDRSPKPKEEPCGKSPQDEIESCCQSYQAEINPCHGATQAQGESDSAQSPLPAELTKGDSLIQHVSHINQFIENSLEHFTFDSFGDYLRTARINMNVRQVFRPGQDVDNKDF